MATLDYGRVDAKALSYSRLGTLHQCPRKFQIENAFKLNNGGRTSVTFTFGHAVGMAIQATAEGDSFERMMLRVLLEWDLDLEDTGTLSEQRARKNVWFALEAAERWWDLVHDPKYSDLLGWEVAQIPHPTTGELIPGVELTFSIDCGEGYVYEGHIDLLMFHPVLKKFKVVELKTNSGNQLHEAQYKNSMQAVGYSTVIDCAAKSLGYSNTYDVQYIVYMTKQQQYQSLPFIKTPRDRIVFLSNLITDINYIEMCENQGYYPRNGSSCYDFFRACDYYGTCNMSDEALMNMAKANMSDGAEVFVEGGEDFALFKFTLDDLQDEQLLKANEVLEEVRNG